MMKNKLKMQIQELYDTSSKTYDLQTSKSMNWGIKKIFSSIKQSEDLVVLDLGCGTGNTILTLIRKIKGKFYGIDISPGMINIARNKSKKLGCKNIQFKVGDSENIEFSNSTFDIVISNIAFHWFLNKNLVLSEVFRVLKPKGKLIMTFCGDTHFTEIKQIFSKIVSKHKEYPKLCQLATFLNGMHLTVDEIKKILERTGFCSVKIDVFYGKTALYFQKSKKNLKTPNFLNSIGIKIFHKKTKPYLWNHGIGKLIMNVYEEIGILDVLERETVKEIKKITPKKELKISTCMIKVVAKKPTVKT